MLGDETGTLIGSGLAWALTIGLLLLLLVGSIGTVLLASWRRRTKKEEPPWKPRSKVE